MKLTIVIPTKNRANSLHEAVTFVAPQLKSKDEIIIIDNNSTDNTKKIVDSLKNSSFLPLISYYKEINSGPSYARNLGIEKSSGDIVAFLDDDCMVSDNWVKIIKKFYSLKKNKNTILQGKIIHSISKESLSFKMLVAQNEYVRKTLFKDNPDLYINYINAGNFACTRETVQKYQYFFDEKNFPYICEERELAQRLNLDGLIIKLSSDLLVIHKKQKSRFIDYIRTSYLYGFYSGKLMKKFKSDRSILDLFKKEIKQKFNRSVFSEIGYIASKVGENLIKKTIIFLYLLFKEMIYSVGFFFGKNAKIY